MLISKHFACVFIYLDSPQNVSVRGTDFSANNLAAENLRFTQDTPREKRKSQRSSYFLKIKPNSSWMTPYKNLTTAGK